MQPTEPNVPGIPPTGAGRHSRAETSVDLLPEVRLGQRLRERRERAGWTQVRFADELEKATGYKLDPTAITRIERGDRSVRLNEAVAICLVIGLSLDEVIAPHPGGLDEQIDKALAEHESAVFAERFWRREAEARASRLAELRAARGDGRRQRGSKAQKQATGAATRFVGVLRGYDKTQVDHYVQRAEHEIATLADECEQAYDQIIQLAAQVQALQQQLADRQAAKPSKTEEEA